MYPSKRIGCRTPVRRHLRCRDSRKPSLRRFSLSSTIPDPKILRLFCYRPCPASFGSISIIPQTSQTNISTHLSSLPLTHSCALSDESRLLSDTYHHSRSVADCIARRGSQTAVGILCQVASGTVSQMISERACGTTP